MSFVITLVDYRPSPRFPPVTTPWTQARFAYSPTAGGTFTVFDTVALSPLDSDPTHPLTRNLTTLLAPAPTGYFQVVFLDAAGNQQPTLPVAYPPAGFTYSGDPSTSDLDAVRFEISDTDSGAPLLLDDEITYALDAEAGSDTPRPPVGILSAAARCLESLARKFAAQADTEVGSLKTNYSKQAATYADRAKELRARAAGMHAPFAGGMSKSAKRAAQDDDDLVQPTFARDQFRNPWTGPETPQFPVTNDERG